MAGLCRARKHFESSSGGISYPNVSPEVNWRTGVPKPSAPTNGTLIIIFRCVKFYHMIELLTVFLWSTPNAFIHPVCSKKHEINSPPPWTQCCETNLFQKWETTLQEGLNNTDISVSRKLKATVIFNFSFSDVTIIICSRTRKIWLLLK